MLWSSTDIKCNNQYINIKYVPLGAPNKLKKFTNTFEHKTFIDLSDSNVYVYRTVTFCMLYVYSSKQTVHQYKSIQTDKVNIAINILIRLLSIKVLCTQFHCRHVYLAEQKILILEKTV